MTQIGLPIESRLKDPVWSYGYHGGGLQPFTFWTSLNYLTYIKKLPSDVRRKILKSMAYELLDKAVELAPEDPGTNTYESANNRGYEPLRESARVFPRKGVWVVKFESRHAAAQHERLDYTHQRGQAKYLETPLREMRGRFLQVIQRHVARELERAAAEAESQSRRAR